MAYANFEEWKYEVDRQFRIRTQCSWDKLCGDDKWLQKAYDRREKPQEFVVRWIKCYKLTDVTMRKHYYD